MRLSPATRLKDRQTVWVSYRNDGSKFEKISDPVGIPATVWAAQFAEVHHDEAIAALPTFEH